MKSLALALMFVVATVAALPSQSKRSLERRDTTANINDYMDRVLNQTSVFLVTNNLDPFELNDRYLVNFTFKDLLGISWKTRLGLDRGEARGLSNIRRSGDAELAYTSDARTLHLQAAVIMDRIDVSYKYAAQVVNIGPAGTFTATVRGLNANLDIAINILKLNATLHDFSITSAKSIKVDVTGLTLLGNLATEAFINTFTFLLKGPILKVIENQVKFGLQAGISNTDPGPITISTSS